MSQEAPLESRWLYKRGSLHPGVRYRLFELQPTLVVWRTAPGAAPSGRFNLSDVNEVTLIHSEVAKRRFACVVATERRTYHLETSVASDARSWARAVVSACRALDGDDGARDDYKPELELQETLTRYQRANKKGKIRHSSASSSKHTNSSAIPLYYQKILDRIEELQDAKERAKRKALAAAADVAAECSDAHYDALALRSAFERDVDDDLFWQGLTSSKNPKMLSARRNSSTGGHLAEDSATDSSMVVSLPIGSSESETTRHVAERLDDRLKGVRASLAPRLFYATRLHAMAARETRRALLAGWARCGRAKADVKKGLDHDTLSWERRWSDSAALKKPETMSVWMHLDRHILRIYSFPTTNGDSAEDDGLPALDLVTTHSNVAFLDVVAPSKPSSDFEDGDDVDDVIQAGLKRASPLWRAIIGRRTLRLERVVAHGELSLDQEARDAIAVIGAESALQDDFDDRDGATPRVLVVDDTLRDVEAAEGVIGEQCTNNDAPNVARGGTGSPWFEATFRHGRRLRLVGRDLQRMSTWYRTLEDAAKSSKTLSVAVVLDMRNAACARPSLAPKAPRFAIDIVVANPAEAVYTIVLPSEEQRTRWLVALDEAILDAVNPNRRKRRRSIDIEELVNAEGEEELAPRDPSLPEQELGVDAPCDPSEPDRVVPEVNAAPDGDTPRDEPSLSARSRSRPEIDSNVSGRHQLVHKGNAAKEEIGRSDAGDVTCDEPALPVSKSPGPNATSDVLQQQQQRQYKLKHKEDVVEQATPRDTAVPDESSSSSETYLRTSSHPQTEICTEVSKHRQPIKEEDAEEKVSPGVTALPNGDVPSNEPSVTVSCPPESKLTTERQVSQSPQQLRRKLKHEECTKEEAVKSDVAVHARGISSGDHSLPASKPLGSNIRGESPQPQPQQQQQQVVVVREEDAIEKAVRRASTCATETEMNAVALELARLEAENNKRAASARDAAVELRRRRQALSEASFLHGVGGSPSVSRSMASSASPQRQKKKLSGSSSSLVMSRRNRQSRGDAREAKEIVHFLSRGGVVVFKLLPSSTNEMRFEYSVISDDDASATEEVEKRATLLGEYSRWKKSYSLKTSEAEWRAATHSRMRRQVDRWRAALAALEVHVPNESAVVLVRLLDAPEEYARPAKEGDCGIVWAPKAARGGFDVTFTDRAAASAPVVAALLTWTDKHRVLAQRFLRCDSSTTDQEEGSPLEYGRVHRVLFQQATDFLG